MKNAWNKDSQVYMKTLSLVKVIPLSPPAVAEEAKLKDNKGAKDVEVEARDTQFDENAESMEDVKV